MKIVDNYGDIIITDEGPPRTYPAGCQGTSTKRLVLVMI